MPIQNNKYVAPTWENNAPPAMNAEEMQAISNTLAQIQEKANDSYTKNETLTAATASLYNMAGTAVPNDIFVKLSTLFSNDIAIGRYVGTALLGWPDAGKVAMTDWSEKQVGFKPKCVILISSNIAIFEYSYTSNISRFTISGGIFGEGMPLTDKNGYATGAEITNNGFRVRLIRNSISSNTGYATIADSDNAIYNWIAFR